MAQTQRAQGPSETGASGGGAPDAPEMWGKDGLVGDGRYRLTHRLGRGGMAEVFAAEDVRLGRTVAVKLLRADLAEDPVSKARFTREAQSVAGLNHHAVVAVYDSGEDIVGQRTVPYIVMELVEGRTIRELLLNAEAPPPDQALIIVSGVLEALSYSHQHGIVHRDIKPANVIITDGGAVKVMDFGIARALHGAQSTMTQTGMVMGTPQYLSPEQALGKTVDHRSDLYATGCLLYELLALRPPFIGETPLSVVYQHVQDAPAPPSEISEGVPPELDGLVTRSLAKDPDDRFQSAEEMRGLVQYAVQMLGEKGGHTGAWDTGPVVHSSGSAPAMGPAALPHPGHGDTSLGFGMVDPAQGPMLPGGREDDGGFVGGPGGAGGGAGRGRLWLLATLAVIAITVGVVFALDRAAPGTDQAPGTSPTVSDTQDNQPSQSTDEVPTEGTQHGDGTGGQDGYTAPAVPSETATEAPSGTPTYSPSVEPTETATGSTDGTTTGGSSPSATETSTTGSTDTTDGGNTGAVGAPAGTPTI